ncbi:MAG: outer membrane protein transport protein, partial [Deltaproteobacteria bacterium]|nr:outer membrane protein transport protein [Deltaproteobacteria bacterium]
MGGDGSAPEGTDAEGPALPDSLDGDFALAAADNLVGAALHEAWRGGKFDSALSGLAPSITLSEEGLAQKMGLPGGTKLNVSIELAAAPVVGFGREGAPGVHVSLPDLRVGIDVEPPTGVPGRIDVRTIASLGVGFNVDAETGSLGLAVHSLKVDKLELEAGSGAEVVRADPARLEQFIADVGAPMLAEKLAGLPLSPALRPSPELAAYVYLRGIEAEGGWLRAGADLHTPDPSDQTAPDTTAEVPALVPAGMATIQVSGTDDTTPRGLLRYEIHIDGQPVHPEPKFMTFARLSMEDGEHTVSIAAVDLMGNVDAEPITATVVADGTPPNLSVTGAPPAVLADEVVELTWQANDERTGVKTRWELREFKTKDKVGTVVAEGEAGEAGSLKLEEFNRSSLYVVRVVAEDEAGNLTSEEFGFGLEQGGCSAGGGTESSLIAFGLLALLLLRRRRKTATAAIAALGLIAAANTASAQSAGNYLSGATDADGASAYWNPAAMAAGNGTRFDAGSGLSLVRLGFTPEGMAEGSNTFVPKPSPTIGGYTDVLGNKWRLGLTIAIPTASGAEWDNDDPAAAITRYYANSAKNYYVTTTVGASYRPAEWISIGVGPNIVYGRLDAKFDKDMAIQLNRTVGSSSTDSPFPSQHPDLVAPVDLQTAGWGVGAVGGILLTPNKYISIGASVHTPVTVGATGTLEADYSESMQRFIAAAAPSAELPEMAGDVAVDLKLPLSVFSAVSITPTANWEIRVDHRFLDYSSVANTDVIMVEVTSPDLKDTSIVKGYNDVHSVGLRLGRSFYGGRGRAAMSSRWERNKVPELTATPSNVDFNKYEVGAAVQWAFSRRFAMTGQYSHHFLTSRDVDQSLHRTVADPNLDAYNHPAPLGSYNGAADTFSLFLSAFY